MVKCIGLSLDRTDNCTATTLGMVSPQTEYDAAVTRPLLEACVATCKSCGDECERDSRPAHSAAREMPGQLKAHAQARRMTPALLPPTAAAGCCKATLVRIR